MQEISGKEAFGKPGNEARWSHSNKDGVGTAYSASSHLWFTIWNGIVTEVYYPTVDRPQIRDFQYLVTDGKTFFHEEKSDLTIKMERVADHVLGYRCVNADHDGRYTITKDEPASPAKTKSFWRPSRSSPSVPHIWRLVAQTTRAIPFSPTANVS